MDLIVKWVTQIIVFILIASMIELITPENMMKKYVNLVLGLILILIFAQPFLYLLNVDFLSKLNEAEERLFNQEDELNESYNLIEKQKLDIQAEQDAYILAKVKERLIDEANDVLVDEEELMITDIQFVFAHDKLDTYDDLEEVIVYVQDAEAKKDDLIEPIVIELDEDLDDKRQESDLTKRQAEDVQTVLRHVWDLEDKKVTIKWEGGTS